MKRYKQKIVKIVLLVWIAKNPKRNNEIIGLNFLMLDEKVCLHTYKLVYIRFMLLLCPSCRCRYCKTKQSKPMNNNIPI